MLLRDIAVRGRAADAGSVPSMWIKVRPFVCVPVSSVVVVVVFTSRTRSR